MTLQLLLLTGYFTTWPYPSWLEKTSRRLSRLIKSCLSKWKNPRRGLRPSAPNRAPLGLRLLLWVIVVGLGGLLQPWPCKWLMVELGGLRPTQHPNFLRYWGNSSQNPSMENQGKSLTCPILPTGQRGPGCPPVQA